MVYSLDILNTSEQDLAFVQEYKPVPTRAVSIYYNGSGIHSIAGPTPFIDFSTTIERNEAGEPVVITNKITLNGTIVKGYTDTELFNASGISGVAGSISGLQNIFTTNTCGTFEIRCKSSPGAAEMSLFNKNNVKVISFEANKSNDNWLVTANYSVTLEYYEPVYSGWYVKEYSDSWNIEPLEDYIYTKGMVSVIQKSEYDNPLLKPNAATLSSQQPRSSSINTGATPNAPIDIHYVNIPRFKISRALSAVGIPSADPVCYSGTAKQQINNNTYPQTAMSAFNNAKKWVMERSSSVFSLSSNDTNTGSVWNPFNNKGYLYNHIRTVNFNILSAKYELIDSWLAMPTGINFLEDYSIDVSTDDKYIHTVRIQGEIIGLNISNPTITGLPYVSGSGDPLKFDLSSSTGFLDNVNLSQHNIIDSNVVSTNNNLSLSKYNNALSGWLYEVKPYLYRRACIPMNSSADRQKNYVPPLSNPPSPPNNPVYSKHGVLNIIPISTSETHNPKKGSISYAYEFNNKFTIISGVLYENISIEETGPTDVIGEAFVLGRSLGPVLQNLGTRTSTKKNVSIEVGVIPPSSMKGFFMQNSECPLWTGGTVYTTITGMIEGLKPFGDRISYIFGNTNFNRANNNNAQGQVYVTSDNQTWDPSMGRFVKSIGWIYQQCNNNKHYLDY